MKLRTACAVAAGLLLWYGNAAATQCLPHPTETSAVNIGVVSVDTTVANNIVQKANLEVCIWAVNTTTTEATFEVQAITITGAGTSIDTVATSTILSRLRAATVQGMIEQQYLTCTASRDTVRLYHAATVTRSGTGTSTTFTAASGSATNFYDIEFYYPMGESVPRITEVGSGEVGGTIY